MEAIPSPALEVDIAGLEARLGNAGWQTLVNAGVMLIARKEHEATIYATGKVVVKSQDGRVAQQVWDELQPILVGASVP